MSYSLGIDLGTTYSAAAVHRDGRARIVELGTRSASIPSVVFLRDDETVLAGEAAQRRAASEPHRVAREFKRRLGDTTPLLLGGAAYSAEALTARLLGWIVEQVAEREGGPPDLVTITHPANWGPYKIDLLQQAIRLAGLGDAELITEPEAAARHYASHERVDDGSLIAVYDLGGGTFDAAILRKTESGFEPLGRPEGIERLGGIDFDAAVLGHVVRALDGAVEALDQDDPGTVQALARLRQDCVEAKEGLSSDTDVSIPVLLPTVQTEVRLTRSEFEGMIRPALADSLEAMRRALASAEVEADDVSAVLLVGGSSRVPLVAQLVSNEFGRPIAIDADPKHAIALGAALIAADRAASGVAAAGAAAAAAIVGDEALPPTPEPEVAEPGPPDEVLIVPQEPEPVAIDSPPPSEPAAATATMPAAASASSGGGSKSRLPIYIGAGFGLLVAVIAAVVIIGGSGGDSPEEAEAAATTLVATGDQTPVDDDEPATAAAATPTSELTASTEPEDEVAATATDPPVTEPPTTDPATTTTAASTTTTTTLPPPTPCPVGPERTACITSISLDADGGLVAPFETTGFVPELEPIDFHVHFYFDSVVGDDERNAGSEGTGGDWRLWDAPSTFTATGGDGDRPGYTLADAEAVGATQLCSIVATVSHAAVTGTGNCIDLPSETIDATDWLAGYTTEIRTNFVTSCTAEAGAGAGSSCECVYDELATTLPFEQFLLLDSDPDLLDDPSAAIATDAIAACAP